TPSAAIYSNLSSRQGGSHEQAHGARDRIPAAAGLLGGRGQYDPSQARRSHGAEGAGERADACANAPRDPAADRPRHVPRVGRARKSPDGILVPFSSPPQTTSGSLIRKVSGVWVHGRAGWSAPPYAGRSRNLAARRRAGR